MDAIDWYWIRYQRELKRHKAVIRALNREFGRFVQEQQHDVFVGQSFFQYDDSDVDHCGSSPKL